LPFKEPSGHSTRAPDRQDGVINVCEIKFSIDKKYARELRQARDIRTGDGDKEGDSLPLVTTQGAKANEFSVELVQNSLTALTRVPKLRPFRHVGGRWNLLPYAGCDFVSRINTRSVAGDYI
jgi:hypothetical protein